jgi:hypothetical protein
MLVCSEQTQIRQHGYAKGVLNTSLVLTGSAGMFMTAVKLQSYPDDSHRGKPDF